MCVFACSCIHLYVGVFVCVTTEAPEINFSTDRCDYTWFPSRCPRMCAGNMKYINFKKKKRQVNCDSCASCLDYFGPDEFTSSTSTLWWKYRQAGDVYRDEPFSEKGQSRCSPRLAITKPYKTPLKFNSIPKVVFYHKHCLEAIKCYYIRSD